MNELTNKKESSHKRYERNIKPALWIKKNLLAELLVIFLWEPMKQLKPTLLFTGKETAIKWLKED